MSKLSAILFLCLAGWSFSMPAWSGEAGRVQFVQGAVQASDASGRARVLQKGDVVNEGDTLATSAGASAQLRMADGGFIAVRPDTRMKIDSFRFGKAEERESSFLSLFKGGFRAITGMIGRLRKEDYRITTPAATIGIRGTDHETVVVPGDSLVAAGVAAGTYNKVNAGETIITTDKGTLNVLPNQMGYAGGMNQMPKQLPVNANLFAAALPPPAGAKVAAQDSQQGEAPRETAVVDNTAQQQTVSAGTTATTSETSGTGTTLGLVTTTIVQQPITSTSGTALSGATATLPGLPAAGQGATAYFTQNATGGLGYILSDTVKYTNDALGLLSGFSTAGGYVALRNTATVVDSGSVMLSATESIGWGRWSGTGATISLPQSVAVPAYNLHYVGGNPATQIPVTGIVNYIYAGGTLPTNSAGVTGTVTSASLSVDFATTSLSFGVGVSFAGGSYAGSGTGQFGANGVIGLSAMTVTCTPTCATGPAPSGQFAGALLGTGATGAGLVYRITPTVVAGAAPGDITGAVAFKR